MSHRLVPTVAACVALPWIVVPNAAQIVSPATSRLMGIVKSPDGTPMEGVGISAKREGSTITTSVWTDRNGVYSFPPLENGDYRVWAQAVGFDMNRARRLIASGAKVQQDFALQPAEYFGNQLSGAEWLESLPANTPEDRRMKKVVFNSCVVPSDRACPGKAFQCGRLGAARGADGKDDPRYRSRGPTRRR